MGRRVVLVEEPLDGVRPVPLWALLAVKSLKLFQDVEVGGRIDGGSFWDKVLEEGYDIEIWGKWNGQLNFTW